MADVSAPAKFNFETEFVKNSPYNTDPLTVQKIKQEGMAEGIAEGEKNAEKRLYDEFAAQLGQLEEHYAQLEEARLAYVKILTEKSVKLLQASLQHLLQDAAQNYPEELLKSTLTQILTAMGEASQLKIRIHPSSRAYLEKLKPTLLQGRQIEFLDDVQMAVGSCVAEWETGGMDARLEEMLEDIQSLFHGASFANPTAEDLPKETEETQQKTEEMGTETPSKETENP